jgi:small conductance mechanosensitive channel
MPRWITRLLLAAIALCGAVAVAQVRPPLWPPPAAQVQAPEPPAPAEPTPLVKVLREPQTWRELFQQFLGRVVDFLPRLLAAVLVVLLFVLFHRMASRAVARALRDSKADPAMQAVGQRLARYVFYGFGLLMAANQLGFEVGSVLAGLGIIGIAIGFAAQDLLSNLIAGFTIFWDRPFRIGDVVTIAGIQGTVKEIGLRSTRLQTPDSRDVILPNKDVINQTIANLTLTPELRVDLPIGIGHGEDLRRVREVLVAVTEGHAEIAERPAAHMVVVAVAESAVQVELRFFARDARNEKVLRAEILERVKLALDAAGIQIPVTQRVVRVSGPVEFVAPPAAPR